MLGAYRFLLPFIYYLLRFISFFSPAMREFLEARNGLLDRWKKSSFHQPIWIHVSSVGELEQIRPAIEAMPGKEIVLSYFSTSLPRLLKDFSFVHFADYLPLDFQSNMDELMALVKPKVLVLNRYDIWPNHLAAAKKMNVPVILVNASTPPLGVWGRTSLWLRRGLFQEVHAWTFVDSVAAAAWEPYVKDKARGLVTGNPRVDRALSRVDLALSQKKASEKLKFWQKRKFCLVAGSTWAEDEHLLLAAWSKLGSLERSLVIVPHEPTPEHLHKLEKNLAKSGLTFSLFSQLNQPVNPDVLIVDQRGFLAEIYGVGNLAYVGGGFGKQIHSIIEPVAHGLPVAFGPNYQRSPEAVALIAADAASSHTNPDELREWILDLNKNGQNAHRAREALRVFLQIHRGAGQRVADFLLL